MATATTTLTPTPSESPKLVKKHSMGEARDTSNVVQTVFGCQHIRGFLGAARGPALEKYTHLISVLRQNGNLAPRWHKHDDRTSITTAVTYLCLQCPNVSITREKHRKDHMFSAESTNGHIFCHECKDFVYDPSFEEIRDGYKKKRKRHTMSGEDERLVRVNSTSIPCAATGLRGLYNMGQTCFMSVVLQSLIHNPLVRAYYLSEGHRSADCEREACTSCALDDIFVDFYGQEKHEGYGAVHMLQGCWKGGGALAGYSQQDAHEFLGFILNILHTANTAEDEEGNEKKPTNGNKDCDCIIHKTFGGLLRSTVTCTKCQNTTTTLDPFMDLSLEIKSPAAGPARKKKLALTNGASSAKEPPPMELTDCLDKFTSPETLSADNYTCRMCSSSQEAKKRMMLYRAPLTLPIHLKRFTHSKTLSQSSKVDVRIRFPLTLDLAPYFSNAVKKKKKASEIKAETNGEEKSHTKGSDELQEEADVSVSEPIYELSSVIVHKGKMDNGHYISYSRQENDWFRFDDSMVVQVSEKEVLNAEAYMLFYVVREF